MTSTTDQIEELIESHLYLAERAVGEAKLKYRRLDRDEVYSTALHALHWAAQRYVNNSAQDKRPFHALALTAVRRMIFHLFSTRVSLKHGGRDAIHLSLEQAMDAEDEEQLLELEKAAAAVSSRAKRLNDAALNRLLAQLRQLATDDLIQVCTGRYEAHIKTRPFVELRAEELQRFRSYIRQGSPTECWPWLGYTCKGHGYLELWREPPQSGRSRLLIYKVELLAYVIAGGHPEDKITQRCRNLVCCNPTHLVVVQRHAPDLDAEALCHCIRQLPEDDRHVIAQAILAGQQAGPQSLAQEIFQ